MKIALLSSLLLCTVGVAAEEVQIDGHKFRVADGYTIKKIAGPPLVDRPIVADFDELGRLYVADSSGSNEAPQKQLANPTHRIVRLEDTDGDGTFDKSTVYADKMMFPEGAMWRDGSLFVAAPPSIWKLTDTDGDGKCDKREEWFKGKTLTGCANDLHGPYNGPDGYIYWTKGAFAEQTYTLPNGKLFKTKASHIFRAKPDGTGIEPMMTGGMDNPVEVAWSSAGEMFFTTTFLQHPGGGKRDGIIHAVYGGVWGKDHDVINGHIRTSPDLMPVMTHLGPAAPSGLMRLESDSSWPPKDTLIAALFNLHKVTRHELVPDGATFKTIDTDLVTVTDHHDFHPTDVLEDADGSILVIDTGGWYKLCCPTSQIGKPEVLGGIYRVTKIEKYAKRLEDPRGLQLDWSNPTAQQLAIRLKDPRFAVRKRANAAFNRTGSEWGESARAALLGLVRNDRQIEYQPDAVWAAARLPRAEDRNLVLASALEAGHHRTRQAAGHVASLFARDLKGQSGLLRNLLADKDAACARVAAEALGRIGDSGSIIKALLDRLASGPIDTVLAHAITYALIEMDARDVPKDYSWKDPAQSIAMMVARDQLGVELIPDLIKAGFLSEDRGIQRTTEWIASRNPRWDAFVAELLDTKIEQGFAKNRRTEQIAQLARFSGNNQVRASIGRRLSDEKLPIDSRLALLQAVAKSGLEKMPEEWVRGIASALQLDDAVLIQAAISAAKTLPSTDQAGLALSLRRVAESAAFTDPVRLDALAAIPGGSGNLSEATFKLLLDALAADKPVATRLLAADVLSKASLKLDQLDAIAEILKTAGPLDTPRLLAVFDKATDEETGRLLITSLKDSPALPSLRINELKPRFAKFGETVAKDADILYERIEKANADQKAKLDEFAKNLSSGDVIRGQAVFNGTKAACLSCHAIGYVGGTIGPDLSRIGAIREDRDLLESIVYPSASFVRSYEPMIVATKSGQVHSGLLKKDAPDELVLILAADKEIRIPRADVEELKPGSVSVMPSGLETQMSKTELADLIAFLRSRK